MVLEKLYNWESLMINPSPLKLNSMLLTQEGFREGPPHKIVKHVTNLDN